jgi:hypothetical protein
MDLKRKSLKQFMVFPSGVTERLLISFNKMQVPLKVLDYRSGNERRKNCRDRAIYACHCVPHDIIIPKCKSLFPSIPVVCPETVPTGLTTLNHFWFALVRKFDTDWEFWNCSNCVSLLLTHRLKNGHIGKFFIPVISISDIISGSIFRCWGC